MVKYQGFLVSKFHDSRCLWVEMSLKARVEQRVIATRQLSVIHTCTYMYIFMIYFLLTDLYTHVYVFSYTYMGIDTYICVEVYMYIFVDTAINIHMNVYVCIKGPHPH